MEFLEAKKDNYKYMGGYNSGLTAFTTMINLIVIIVGGFCITRGIVNVTDMITFLLYINIYNKSKEERSEKTMRNERSS